LEIKGYNSSVLDLAEEMNNLSCTPIETRPEAKFTRFIINQWFRTIGGEELSPIENSFDNLIHCLKQLDWIIEYYGILAKNMHMYTISTKNSFMG